MTPRAVVLLLVTAVVLSTGPAAAQVPDCTDRARRIACSLRAASLAELRDTVLPRMEYELRYWILGGDYLRPDILLILHDHGGRVSGAVWLLWAGDGMTTPFAQARCGRQWTTPVGGICASLAPGPKAWWTVLEQLEAIGVPTLREQPETPRRMYEDGFTHLLEERRGDDYWRRTLHGAEGGEGPLAPIELEAARILGCAARKVGDGPCIAGEGPPPLDSAMVTAAIVEHLIAEAGGRTADAVLRPVRIDTLQGEWNRRVARALGAEAPAVLPMLSDSMAHHAPLVEVDVEPLEPEGFHVRIESSSCSPDGTAGGGSSAYRITRWRPRLIQYHGGAVTGWHGECTPWRRKGP